MLEGRATTAQEKHELMVRLEAAWLKVPELRLGQLIANVAREEGCWDQDKRADFTWLFYVEDTALLDSLEEIRWKDV